MRSHDITLQDMASQVITSYDITSYETTRYDIKSPDMTLQMVTYVTLCSVILLQELSPDSRRIGAQIYRSQSDKSWLLFVHWTHGAQEHRENGW